jgi:hypothetical protein
MSHRRRSPSGPPPPQVTAKLAKSPVCCSIQRYSDGLKTAPVIVMACNTHAKHVIPGIMRAAQELDATALSWRR